MQNSNEEIIDLTSTNYHVPCKKPRIIIDGIIDLANDSFDAEKNEDTHKNKTNTRKSKVKSSNKKTIETDNEENLAKERLCSICWEKLGKNPLGSTKCGHVYCFACLEKSVKSNKRCPTCRTLLKGALAYHRLYIEFD